MLSSLVFQFGYPLVSDDPDWGWRVMLWIGVLPGVVVFAVMWTVPESPVWLEQQRHLRAAGQTERALARRGCSIATCAWVTMHTSLLMGAFMFSYHSITFWYPTLLAKMQASAAARSGRAQRRRDDRLGDLRPAVGDAARPPRRGDARHGDRPAVGAALRVVVDPTLLLLGALLMGFFAAGAWGIVPGYLTERFPTDARGVGTGFAYHVGAGLGSFTPYLIGALQDSGVVCDRDARVHRSAAACW